MAIVQLKLFKVFAKKLQFSVRIPSTKSDILPLIGTSPEFAAHNSGTLMYVLLFTHVPRGKGKSANEEDESDEEGQQAPEQQESSKSSPPRTQIGYTSC